MTTHPPEPKPRRKWHFYKWLVLLIVATFAYAQWRAYAFNSALKQAEALGWRVEYIEPFYTIRTNWNAAFKKETWLNGVTIVAIPTGKHFEQHYDIVQQLNPLSLYIGQSQSLRDLSALNGHTRLGLLCIESAPSLTNLDALQNFTTLQSIEIHDAAALTNLDGLKNLLAVKTLVLPNASKLTNLDALKNLSALEYLVLIRCTGLTNVDGLQNHKKLQTVYLGGCTGLTNVDGLKKLPALNDVFLSGCTGLTKESIEALKATLPSTNVDTGEPPPFPEPNELDTPPGARDTDR